ncbi:MAG TPA: ABC transporter permease [Acidimicrobiia bacterium]|nr:ABC transporter permease [Acidimicrobiia bacterium]
MKTLTGTSQLIRQILRRDRGRLAVWIAALAGFPIITANAFVELYATPSARTDLVATFGSNPAYSALLGPIYDSSIGALTAWRIGVIGSVLVGLMAILTVIRNTRDEEESGRQELLGATVLGRHALLTAALVVATGAGFVIGLLITAGLTGLGLEINGAVAYGAGVATLAAAFAAIGGTCAQLTSGGGAARGVGVGVLGLTFMLRAVGDATEASAAGWLSPIGWFTRLRPFAGEQWWVLALPVGLAIVLGATAFLLASRRDLGAGILPARAGPAEGPISLRNPLGLAWRLHRASLLGWSLGVMVLAALYGTVANNVSEIFEGNPQLADALAQLGGADRLTDTFFSFTAGVLALFTGAYSIRTALRLRAEEEAIRAEPLLATPTARWRWMGSHLMFAFLGPALMLLIGGVVMGATYGSAVGDIGGQLMRVIPITLAQLPAVWVLTGATAAIYGWLPRFTGVTWALLMVFLFLGQVGQILRFPDWLLNLSPFTHTAALTPDDLRLLPLLLLIAVVGILSGLGFFAFRRRDLVA